MYKILLIIIFLFTSYIKAPASDEIPSILGPQPASFSEIEGKVQTVFHKITKGAFYLGAGAVFGSAFVLTRLGSEICQMTPLAPTIGNEWHLLSELCASAARHTFIQIFKNPTFQKPAFKGIPPSQYSWYLNQKTLSEIPALSKENKELLYFLQKRWLAKSTGFFPSIVDWVCPTFGVTMQVHPESNNCYARLPAMKLPLPYIKRVEAWKENLPQPQSYPLILTRPSNVQDYLPSCLVLSENEPMETVVEKLALKLSTAESNVFVDLTDVLKSETEEKEKWAQAWNTYQNEFARVCNQQKLNLNYVICFQRLRQKDVGGIRLLPFHDSHTEEIEKHHAFLLDWVSHFGLSANRVELDRWPVSATSPVQESGGFPISVELQIKEEFISYLHAYEQNWKSNHPQKTLMLKGALKVLYGLFDALSENKWSEIMHCPTRSPVTKISMIRIKEELNQLAQEGDQVLFFDAISHIEQIHANFSTLLEIFSPFTSADFPIIYRDLLTIIPPSLKSLASYGIHSSGMSNVAGIFKAVEKMFGRTPRVIYGENTYYECMIATDLATIASPIAQATEKDWEEADLLIAQFNPVLKRIDLYVKDYGVENVSQMLRKSLNSRQGRPLILALDYTLDFINSDRTLQLLAEFEEEIKRGDLNVVAFRSGSKFDIFGIDNYCGAPFFMIHSEDPKWACFDSLLIDPVLQTDRLSMNWFCLAYQRASVELECYQRQIFENTRALLNKIPPRLQNNKGEGYRVVPIKEEADAAFIDIKISGPLHQIRGSALVAGSLYMICMEEKHPIFYRLSLGFYHPNFAVLFTEKCTTIRLTVGLDPSQVDTLAKCFEKIDALSGRSEKLSKNMPSPSLNVPKVIQPSF